MKWHTEGFSLKPRAKRSAPISHEAAYVQLFLKPRAKRSALRERKGGRGGGGREGGRDEGKGGILGSGLPLTLY